jgi:GNAT superfamily N-acetyltransferase
MKFTKHIGGEVISSLEMYCVHLPSRYVCVIEEVWTREDHRKHGYATELINKALKEARDRGADCVELTVRQDKPHIKAFYESFGFTDRLNTAMRLTLKEMKPWNKI